MSAYDELTRLYQRTPEEGLDFRIDDEAVLPEPVGDTRLGAWFGEADLKRAIVARVAWHREQDLLVQGTYQEPWRDGTKFKGCLVGCALPLVSERWVNDRCHDGNTSQWHVVLERFLNIPVEIGLLLDDVFEESFEADAPHYAVELLNAIPVGADLSREDLWMELEQEWHREEPDLLIKALSNLPLVTR